MTLHNVRTEVGSTPAWVFSFSQAGDFETMSPDKTNIPPAKPAPEATNPDLANAAAILSGLLASGHYTNINGPYSPNAVIHAVELLEQLKGRLPVKAA